jgi:hypothetical protein
MKRPLQIMGLARPTKKQRVEENNVKSARAAKAVVLLRKHPNWDPEDLTTLLTKCPDVDIDQGEAMLRNNPNISLQDIAEYVKAHPDVDAVRLVQLAAEDSSLTLSMAAKLANILNYFGMDQSFSVMGEAREFLLNAGEKYVKFLQEDAVEKAIALSGWIWGGRSTSRLSVLPPLPGR